MKKTILYDKHYNLGAKILPFAGYSMPIVYPDGILSECKEVRNNVGIFDVSHMGQFRISGLGSKEFLQKLLINDITKLKVGDYVLGKYGTGTIQKMELCENIGDKYGINVSEVWLTDIDRVVVDLENNRFEYGKDLDFINY